MAKTIKWHAIYTANLNPRVEESKISKDIILSVDELKKWFPLRTGFLESVFLKQIYVRAIDSISFDVNRRETFGLVGESGCGKTTMAKLIVGLIKPNSGHIYFEGKDISVIKKREEILKFRRKVQMIFQDPYMSLSPLLNVYDLTSEPLKFHKISNTKTEMKKKVKEVFEITGLPTDKEFMSRKPLQLSGGQRQRVELARRIILNPELLIADEPVSMLDASLKGTILNLLIDLKEKFDLTMIMITHDLSVAWYFCDRIAVMYLGKIVEIGDVVEVIRNPLHPYAKALISAVPTTDPQTKCYLNIEQKILKMISTPINVCVGCRFHLRCNQKMGRCADVEPKLVNVGKDHKVACHLYN